MASTSSRVQQCSAAFACILLLSLFTSARAGPIPDWIINPPTTTEAPTVGGFHFKLSEDIVVNATKDVVLKDYTITDLGKDNELFAEESSGLDKVSGIFRPSTGYYFLSTLVHVVVVAQEEAASSQSAENSTNNAVEGEKEPRVTVSICINANCGQSAVLRSSSVVPSSGDLHTFSISGILDLKQGQQLTVQVQNHSSNRQVTVSQQSAFNAYLMKEHD